MRNGGDLALDDAASGRAGWEKNIADGVTADRGQGEIRHLAQEGIRNLGDDARTVTGSGIRTHRTAMLKVSKRFKGEGDDVVARGTAQRCDHRETAGVTLVGRVVQSLRLRHTAEPREGRFLHMSTVLAK